jgi:hypothetical protein
MSRYSVIFILLLFCTRPTVAFDPFSMLAAASTVVNGVSAITGAVSDVASTIDAFGELYSEIDSDAEVNPESKRLIRKIKDIENTAAEIGYTKDEVSDLLSNDKESAQDLEKLAKKLTQAIRTGKKVSALFKKLEKKAQAAEVEQLSVQRQQLRLQHRLLNEQIEARLDQRLEKLRAIKEHQASLNTIQKELRDRGALVFGKTGIFCFPKKDKVLQKAIEHAKRTAPFFAGLILLAFLLRLLFYQFGFYAANHYGDLIRDALLCMFLLATFGQIIEAGLAISDSLSEKVAFGKASALREPSQTPAFELSKLATSTALTLQWIGTWIRYLLFVLADFIFNFGLAFIIFLFPVVIFVSQMFNFPVAWPAFLSGFLLLTLWPVFWNLTGTLASELWVMDTQSTSDMLKSALFSVLQCISPFVSIYLLKGHSLSSSISSTVGTATSSTKPVSNFAKGAAMAAAGRHGGSGSGRAIGATARYAARQGAGRFSAAAAQYKQAHQENNSSSGADIYTKAPPNRSSRLFAAAKGFVLNEANTPSGPSTKSVSQQFVRGFKNSKSFKPKTNYRHKPFKKS